MFVYGFHKIAMAAKAVSKAATKAVAAEKSVAKAVKPKAVSKPKVQAPAPAAPAPAAVAPKPPKEIALQQKPQKQPQQPKQPKQPGDGAKKSGDPFWDHLERNKGYYAAGLGGYALAKQLDRD